MLLSCPSLHSFSLTPQASQELVCLLPSSGMFPAWSCSFSLQQVAQLFLNKLKKYQTIFGAMRCVPQKVKLMLSAGAALRSKFLLM